MATSFFSLPAELRNVIYQLYASQAAKTQAKAAAFVVVGNRIIPPPLTYGSHQVQKEFWPVWDKMKPDIFRAKKLRAVVVDLDFEPLLDYIWAQDEKAPLLSTKGELDLLLVFTEQSLAVRRKTALQRKRDMHEWIDLLAELQELPKTVHKSDPKPFLYRWEVQPPPPELEFEKSALMDAMAGCMFEMPEFAAWRIGKAMAAKLRKRELEAANHGQWEMEGCIGRWKCSKGKEVE